MAAHYLEEARTHGFPPGREDQGLLLLGESLSPDTTPKVYLFLREVYEQNPDLQHTLARMLSTAYLRDTVPNLKAAKQYTEVWLQAPSLTDDDRDLATLQLAEIYLDDHDPEACRSALSKIAPKSPHGGRLCCSPDVWRCSKGTNRRLVSGSGFNNTHGKDKYREAIGLLSDAQTFDDPEGTVMRQSKYLIGLCHLKLGDLRAAAAAFERTAHAVLVHRRRLPPRSACRNVAAAGRTDAALEIYKRAVQDVGDPALYRNYWVPFAELQGRISVAHKNLVAHGDFEAALDLLKASGELSPPDVVTAATAETYEAWAQHLEEAAKTLPPTAAWDKREQSRHLFRIAGEEYRKLSQLRFATEHYPHDLWKGGECFRRGQNFDSAIELSVHICSA